MSSVRVRTVAVLVASLLLLTGCAVPIPTMLGGTPTAVVPADPLDAVRPYAPGLHERPETFEGAAATAATGATGQAATITLGAGADPRGTFANANVGLSFEASDLADERWEPGASSLDHLLGSLESPSLRFGGNSVDRRVWWTSTGEPAPSWAEATVTPDDLARLGRFADEVDASVTIVVDLGHRDPVRAADMAAAAHAALGDRLVAVSIGNEPNGFFLASQPQYAMRGADWGPTAYVAEAREYEQAIHARVPGLAIAGPGAFDAVWWRAFIDAKLPGTVAMSQHWYPLWSCPGRTGTVDGRAEPTAANLASAYIHERADTIVGLAGDTASAAGLPLWMEEAGPTSCIGSNGSSRTHAQALWTIDFVLNAASLGVERMNLHSMLNGCSGGAPMSVVCDLGGLDAGSGEIIGQSNYLALLLASQLRRGEFVPVQLEGAAPLYAYAVQDATGTDVVIVNLADPATAGATPISLGGLTGLTLVSASQLTGPALDAVNESSLVPLATTCTLPSSVPVGSATLLRFDAV